MSFSENLEIPMTTLCGWYLVDEVMTSGLLEYRVDTVLGSPIVEGLKFSNMSGVAGISGPKVILFQFR